MNKLNIDTSKVSVKDSIVMISDSINQLIESIEKIYDLSKIDTSYFVTYYDLKKVQDEIKELSLFNLEVVKQVSELNSNFEICMNEIKNCDGVNKNLSNRIDGLFTQLQIINSSIISHNDILININKKAS